MMLQCAMAGCALEVGACALAIGIGGDLYGIAVCECVKQIFAAINEWIHGRSKTNPKLIRQQFVEFIEFHSGVKQLS